MKEWQVLLNTYQQLYNTLMRDINGMDISVLDWQCTDSMVTIGSTLLHIAGIEHLLIESLRGRDVQMIWQTLEWEKFRPGFPRELSTAMPRGHPLSYYLILLQCTKEYTIHFLSKVPSTLLEEKVLFWQQGREFQGEALEPIPCRELIYAIFQHAEYHRGQITFIKYLFRRLS